MAYSVLLTSMPYCFPPSLFLMVFVTIYIPDGPVCLPCSSLCVLCPSPCSPSLGLHLTFFEPTMLLSFLVFFLPSTSTHFPPQPSLRAACCGRGTMCPCGCVPVSRFSASCLNLQRGAIAWIRTPYTLPVYTRLKSACLIAL